MAIQEINVSTGPNTGNGDPIRAAFIKINQNFTTPANAASRMVGTQAGNVMEVGAFGVGVSVSHSTGSVLQLAGFQGLSGTVTGFDFPLQCVTVGWQAGVSVLGVSAIDNRMFFKNINPENPQSFKGGWMEVRHTGNSTVDSNGYIKAASPIANLFNDHIELNEEAKLQNISLEKIDVGHYLISGSLGFAQEGWYIEMPKDANGNVLVAVKYQQLEDNTIEVKTFAKKFDEETGDVVPNLAKPRDIPTGRFISLRLQELPKVEMDPPPTLTPPDFQPTNLAQAVAEALKDGAEQ